MGGLMKTHAALGWTYLLAVFALVGIPPLSGFVGKLLIVQGGFEAGNMWGTLIVLASSLIVLLSAIRTFVYAFWGKPAGKLQDDRRVYRSQMVPAALLVTVSIIYGVGAEWLIPYMADASDILLNPSGYIDAVFKG
jgi:multicomponent Na+:H+ antiporter subunit D